MASVAEGKWGQVDNSNPPKKTGVDLFSGEDVVLVQLEERNATRHNAEITLLRSADEFVVFQAYLYQMKQVIWVTCLGPESDMQPFADRAVAKQYVRWINLVTGY